VVEQPSQSRDEFMDVALVGFRAAYLNHKMPMPSEHLMSSELKYAKTTIFANP
jgi:hypothetical protein